MSLRIHYTLDFAALLLCFNIIYFLRIRGRNSWQKLVFFMSCAYAALLLFVTLMPFQPVRLVNWGEIGRYNLVPFSDISHRYLGAKREALLNVLLFMPLGLLLPELRKIRLPGMLAAAFLLSLGIETVQLLYGLSGALYGRSFDVTDLITNSLGGVLGYLLSRLLSPLTARLRERLSSR